MFNQSAIGFFYHVGWINYHGDIINVAYRQYTENEVWIFDINNQQMIMVSNPVFVDAPAEDPERWGYL